MIVRVNDKVRVVSTQATVMSEDVMTTSDVSRAAARLAEGYVLQVDLLDNTVYLQLGEDTVWVHMDDVELIVTMAVGDTVRLLDPTVFPDAVEGCSSFSSSRLSLSAVFTIEEIDEDDRSALISRVGVSSFWIYIKDLVSNEKATVDPVAPRPDEVTFIITNDSVTLSINGDTDVATVGSSNFAAIRQAVLDEEFTKAHGLMNTSVGVKQWGNGSLQIDSGVVSYNGMPLTGKLVDKVVNLMSEGDKTFQRFANFLTLVLEQESFKTRSRLMDFAAHNQLDLTEEGYIVAFKNVRDDYFDKHSGTFRNMVGDKPSMRRSEVDDDHTTSCAKGLHVCSPTYLEGFWGTSGKTMKVVVNPKNMVSVPYDYNDSKARVCEYEVIEDVTDKINDYL